MNNKYAKVTSVLEAGTEYRVGSLAGETRVTSSDIEVVWTGSFDEALVPYDTVELQDGTVAYVIR